MFPLFQESSALFQQMAFPCPRSRLFDHCVKIAYSDAEPSLPPPPLPPPPLSPSDHDPRPGSLPLIGFVIGASMLFGVFYMVIVRFFIKRPNLRQRSLRNPTNPTDPPILFDTNEEEFVDEEQGPTLDHPIWYIRTVGLDQSAIDSIAAFKFKKGEGLIDSEDCSVCLTEFEDDETLRLLPKCSHAFHVSCIDMWLRSHKNCPLCRAPVIRAAPAASKAANTANSVEGSDVAASVSEVEEGENSGSGTMTTEIVTVRELADSGETETRVWTDPVQGLRRSVSMDAASASEIYRAVGIAINGDRRERIKKGKNLSLSSNSRVIGRSFRLYRMMKKSCSFGSSVHEGEEHGTMKESSSSTKKILMLPSQEY